MKKAPWIACSTIVVALLSLLPASAAPAATDAHLEAIKAELGDGYPLFWEAIDGLFAAYKLDYEYFAGEIRPKSPVPDAIYETISLPPIMKACKGVPKSRWPFVVKEIVGPVLSAPKVAVPTGLEFEAARPRIFPELVAERLLPPEAKLCFVAKSGVAGVYFMLSLRNPAGKEFLTRADAGRWGKDFDALFAIARDNLLGALGEKTSEIKLRGRNVLVVRSGTPYTASLSYFAASRPGWLGEKGMLFIMPAKDWLVIAPIGKTNSFDLVYDLYALSRSLSSPSMDALTSTVYWTDGKKVKELGVYLYDDRIVVTLPDEVKPNFRE